MKTAYQTILMTGANVYSYTKYPVVERLTFDLKELRTKMLPFGDFRQTCYISNLVQL